MSRTPARLIQAVESCREGWNTRAQASSPSAEERTAPRVSRRACLHRAGGHTTGGTAKLAWDGPSAKVWASPKALGRLVWERVWKDRGFCPLPFRNAQGNALQDVPSSPGAASGKPKWCDDLFGGLRSLFWLVPLCTLQHPEAAHVSCLGPGYFPPRSRPYSITVTILPQSHFLRTRLFCPILPFRGPSWSYWANPDNPAQSPISRWAN